jgi:plasmid maintenance system antidote protein VapI
LTKAQANCLDNEDIIVSLGITAQQFNSFLNKDVRGNRVLSSKLRMVTGMPDEIWLRVQAKFNSSHKEHSDCKSIELFEITIHLNIGDSSLSMDDIEDHLYGAGFDDAFISHNGKGAITVSIERAASTGKSCSMK